MEIAIIFLLTLINGFFALSEIAFVSARKSKIEQLASAGSKRAKTVLELLENPENFLSSVQVGITLIGIISGAYGGITLTDDFEQLLLPFEWLAPYSRIVAIVIVIGGITYFSIVVGELIPKSIALNNAESIALSTAPVIKYFTLFTYPFIKLLSFSTSFITRIFGIKGRGQDNISEEELFFLLKSAGKLGVLNKDESEVHQNLFHFSDQIAKSLMTPRNKLEWININASVPEILKSIKNSSHNKFPVCESSIDKIVGVVTAKSYLENYTRRGFDLKDFLSEPLFISQDTTAFGVLTKFRKQKQYIGFITDKYEIVRGVITLKDIMEAILGNLPEQSEGENTDIMKREDGSYFVNGQTSVYDLNQYFKKETIVDNPSQYTTISGFIIHALQRFPENDEMIIHKDIELKVIEMEDRKVNKILLRFNESEKEKVF